MVDRNYDGKNTFFVTAKEGGKLDSSPGGTQETLPLNMGVCCVRYISQKNRNCRLKILQMSSEQLCVDTRGAHSWDLHNLHIAHNSLLNCSLFTAQIVQIPRMRSTRKNAQQKSHWTYRHRFFSYLAKKVKLLYYYKEMYLKRRTTPYL